MLKLTGRLVELRAVLERTPRSGPAPTPEASSPTCGPAGWALAWRVLQLLLPPHHEIPVWLAATLLRAAGRRLRGRSAPAALEVRRDDPRP
jgi:hypothetical protein